KNQFVCVAKKVKEQLRSTFWPEKQKFSAFHLPKSTSKKLVYWPQMKCVLHYFSPKSTFICKSAFQPARRTG
ncbi:hypothetical protein ERO13_D11G215801v2, partial [Gossypium hirsutum]